LKPPANAGKAASPKADHQFEARALEFFVFPPRGKTRSRVRDGVASIFMPPAKTGVPLLVRARNRPQSKRRSPCSEGQFPPPARVIQL